jgi:hypothetical protein
VVYVKLETHWALDDKDIVMLMIKPNAMSRDKTFMC